MGFLSLCFGFWPIKCNPCVLDDFFFLANRGQITDDFLPITRVNLLFEKNLPWEKWSFPAYLLQSFVPSISNQFKTFYALKIRFCKLYNIVMGTFVIGR